jgi:hypothetical protein
MSNESIAQTMTAEAYDALPVNRRCELVNGVATMMAHFRAVLWRRALPLPAG